MEEVLVLMSFFRKFIRAFLYRLRGDYTTEQLIKRGMKVGRNFGRLHGVILDPAHCWLISIGDDVTMAPRVHVLAHDASTKKYLNYTKIGRVNIGDRVFIGAESVILPNVTIGNDVIIGANSVVTKDVPSNVVYAGNPAKFICSIDEYLANNTEKMNNRPCYNVDYTLRGNLTIDRKKQMLDELNGDIGFVD